MLQMQTVDVLVVGLGPAGASAARVAAERGLSVFGVDKKAVFGFPVQCAEFVPLPMSAYASATPVRIQQITGMKSILPSGATASSEFPGLMIDRQSFDAEIVENARRAGAALGAATSLKLLDAQACIATLENADGVFQVKYRLLIAADGPHSRVAKCLQLPALETVNTRQYSVPLLQPYHDTDIWLSDDYPGGYAWLFPKGSVANIGLGADKHFTHDLKMPLDALHQRLCDQGLIGKEILSRTGGAIPVGGMRENLVLRNVVFVGDAAGLTHPITGAGISAAVLSGERAGQAAHEYLNGDGNALQDYEDDMHDQYETTLSRAVKRRRWLKKYWHTKQANEDPVMRRGWIAFDEYFTDEISNGTMENHL